MNYVLLGIDGRPYSSDVKGSGAVVDADLLGDEAVLDLQDRPVRWARNFSPCGRIAVAYQRPATGACPACRTRARSISSKVRFRPRPPA
jgi:hypothetical protein